MKPTETPVVAAPVAPKTLKISGAFCLAPIPQLGFEQSINKKRFPHMDFSIHALGLYVISKGAHVLVPWSNVGSLTVDPE